MSEPRIIPGASVLPPMDTDAGRQQRVEHGEHHEAKAGKPTRHTRDRFGTLNAFVDCTMADLSRAEALTWLVLWRDTRNGTARTSADDIGRRIGASKRAVLTALQKLRDKGLLTRVYKGGLNRGPSTYRVHPMPRGPT